MQVSIAMKRLSIAQVLSAVLVFATASAADNASVLEAPEVNSTSGLIVGHRAGQRSGTYEFLGIKYGQAPTGELRFASPKRYLAPEGTVFEASNWVGLCLQCGNHMVELTETTECRLSIEHSACDDVSQLHQ